MAVSTLTATAAARQAPAVYNATGVQSTTVQYTGSGNTLSDIVLLAKLPDQTRIIDWYARLNSSEALATVKLGFTGNETALGTLTTSGSAETMFDARSLGYQPATMSLSDGQTPHYGYLYATLSAGSFTTSWELDVTILTTHANGP